MRVRRLRCCRFMGWRRNGSVRADGHPVQREVSRQRLPSPPDSAFARSCFHCSADFRALLGDRAAHPARPESEVRGRQLPVPCPIPKSISDKWMSYKIAVLAAKTFLSVRYFVTPPPPRDFSGCLQAGGRKPPSAGWSPRAPERGSSLERAPQGAIGSVDPQVQRTGCTESSDRAIHGGAG